MTSPYVATLSATIILLRFLATSKLLKRLVSRHPFSHTSDRSRNTARSNSLHSTCIQTAFFDFTRKRIGELGGQAIFLFRLARFFCILELLGLTILTLALSLLPEIGSTPILSNTVGFIYFSFCLTYVSTFISVF